jgi:hypothetical protein
LKSGAIICIYGKPPAGWSAKDSLRFKEKTADFAIVRIVTPGTSALMMNHIWLNLISAGVTDIMVAVAKFDQKRKLRIQPDSLRFRVVGMN